MTDPMDISVVALTSDGAQRTTVAKALDDLAIKATSRRCSDCGKYTKFEDLKHVNRDDGGTDRICADCMDDSPATKQLYKAQWSEALQEIDDALDASPAWAWYQGLDSATKAQAFERLAKASPLRPRQNRQKAIADRVTGLLKAEITRRNTAEVVAKTKRNKRKIAKMRRKADALDVAKGEAEQMLADLLATQATATAQLDDIARRVEIVYNNATRAYGAVGKRQDAQAVAAQAREDQIRADYALAANQTRDPDIRAYYLAKAAGEDVDDED